MICFRGQNSKDDDKKPESAGRGRTCRIRSHVNDTASHLHTTPSKRLFLRAFLFFLGVLLGPIAFVQGAAFTFTQSDWNIENPGSIANTPPYTGWDEYSTIEDGVVPGSDIQLKPVNYELIQTSEDGVVDTCDNAVGCDTGGGFGAGTFVDTVISGKGNSSRIHLATTPKFTDWSKRTMGAMPTAGSANQIKVFGNFAYITGGTPGFKIVDISTPVTPTLVGSIATSGTSYDMDVMGDFAYVAVDSAGLQVFDISSPENPTFVVSYDTGGTAYGVTIDGNYAYVANGSEGLKIIDITIPTTLILKGFTPTADIAQGIDVDGNFAYVADGTEGLQIIDISDKNNPTIVETYNTPGSATDIVVLSNVAYVADGNSGLEVIDVSTPSNPSYMGTYNTPGLAKGIDVMGNYGFIADTESGLEIFELLDPSSIRRIGSVKTAGSANDVSVFGGYAYVTDDTSGLEVIDISPSNVPYVFGNEMGTRTVDDVMVKDGYAYVLDPGTGLHIFGVQTPSNMISLGSFPSLGEAKEIEVKENFSGGATGVRTAYVAGGSAGLKILDVSNPANPTMLMTFDPAGTGTAWGVQVIASTAYVADGSDGFHIIDVSDPLTPTLTGSLATSGSAFKVDVVGAYAYIADGSGGLQIIDITTPATPTLKGIYATGGIANDILVKGTYAYVTDQTTGLNIINISTPATPTLTGLLSLYGTAQEIDISGDYAYVANGSGGLHVINISSPSDPKTAFVLDDGSIVNSIDADKNYIYMNMLNDSSGLQVTRVSDYELSGTFESPVLDLGVGRDMTIVRWSPGRQPLGLTLDMEVRAGPGNDCPTGGGGGCSGWSVWTSVTNDFNAGTAFDNMPYMKYKATLNSPGPFVSPRLEKMVFHFLSFPTEIGLVSSVFDTGDDNNFLADISWSEALDAQEVRLQVATSGNNVDWNYCGSGVCSPSTWLDFKGGAINFYDSNISGGMPFMLFGESSDAINDRYFKYKVWFKSDGTGTPTIDDIAIRYDTASLEVFAPGGALSTHTPTAGIAFDVVVKVMDSSGTVILNHDGGNPKTVKFIASLPQPSQGSCVSSFAGGSNMEFIVTGADFVSGVIDPIPQVTVCGVNTTPFAINALEISDGVLASTTPASDLEITAVNIDATSIGLVFTTQPPSTTLISSDFAPSPEVKTQDQNGNVDSSETTAITLAAFTDSLCASTPALGAFNATNLTVPAVQGVAAFTNVSYELTEKIYLQASGSGFTSVCSNGVTVVSAGYVVQIDPIYDALNDAIIVTSSLLRNGTIIVDANMVLKNLDILDKDGNKLNTVSAQTNTVTDSANSIFHTTWNPSISLLPDVAYSIYSEITYDLRDYSGFRSFNVNELGTISADISNITAGVSLVQTTVNNIKTKAEGVKGNVLTLDATIVSNQNKQKAYRTQTLSSLNSITTKIGTILEDTSKTIPDQLITTIKAELEKGEFAEIITTQATVKTGATIPFRFRSAKGLTPKVTVFNSLDVAQILDIPMKEIGGMGLYVLPITFSANWGLGNFMVKVEEITKGTRDHLILDVVSSTGQSSSKSSSTSSSAFTLDTLFIQMNNVNLNMDSLLSSVTTVKSNTENVGSDINDLLKKISKGATSTENDVGDAGGGTAKKLNTYINAVSEIIGPNGNTSDYRTILGKLNGIEDTLNGVGSDAKAAKSFNEDAQFKAEKIRTFVTMIMTEYKEEGGIEDPQEKTEILEEYLTELKNTVKEIPESLTTDGIAGSVEQTLGELNTVTFENDALRNLLPMVKGELEITEVKKVQDLTAVDMQDMRNDVSGLKSLMLEIRGLLDTKVNKPVVHGWLEGN